MSGRGGPGAGLLLSGTAAATTWLAMCSWRDFTTVPGRYLWPLLLLGALVAGVGALARWWRLPGLVVVAAQLLTSGLVASTLLSGSPVPLGPAWGRLLDAFASAGTTASAYAAPVPASAPGVHPLFIAAGLACLLLVDLLACTLRRVPLAGLPLLTVFSVPVGLLGGALTWWIFALTAAGFLLMLFLHEAEQVARWGRNLGEEPVGGGHGVARGTTRATAGRVGGIATALAVILPLGIPTFELRLFDFGQGPGGGSEISVSNPMTDLKRDLVQARNVPLLRIRTDDPAPAYLRIASLTRFSANEWSAGDRDVPPENLATGQLPALQGVARGVPRRTYEYDVTVSDSFSSTWLPTQAPISRIDAPGDWRYDPTTMDFIAGSDGLDAAGEQYSMTGVQLRLAAADLATARPLTGSVGTEYLQLPPGIPSLVRSFATDVTREAPTRFEKAVALQDWFRRDGGFHYDTSVSPGNGTDDLVAFLSTGPDGRRGYCEQFASAMAVMARMLGIPARVSVGFLEPTSVGTDLWEYRSHDLHAWPELYFPGAGWVRFEPTPAQRGTSVPGYTTQQVAVGNPTGGASTSLARDRGQQARTAGPAGTREKPEPSAAGAGAGAQASRWPLVGGLVGTVLVAGLLLLPRGLRRRRRARLLAGGPEDAWVELRATAIDLGVPWPDGRSPRETGTALVAHFGAPLDENTPQRPARGPEVAPDAARALDRLVHELELARYARDGGAGGGHRPLVHAETATCLEALSAGAPRGSRRRAAWWPRSVVSPSRTSPRDELPHAVSVPYGGVVDHVR